MARFEYKSINGLNFIQVHNALDPQQLEHVWAAYSFLKDNFLSSEHTGSAKNEDGTIKKRNKGIFFNTVSPEPVLCREIREMLFGGIAGIADQFAIDSVYRSSPITNWDSLIMQYYLKDGEGYQSHHDVSLFTALLFFNQEPKNFSGGDITFPEFNVTVPFKNNCGIIFPGIAQHQVNPVTQINNSSDIGGRLSIAMLTGIK